MVIFSRTFCTVQSSRAGAHALLHVVPVAGSRLVLLCCFAAVQLLQGKLTASQHLLTCSLLLTETRRSTYTQNTPKATVNATDYPMQLTALNAFSMPSNRNDKHDTHATWIRLHAHDCRDPNLPKPEKQAGTAFTPHSLLITQNKVLYSKVQSCES